MQKHWDNFLYGLFFGMGFIVAFAVLRFIVYILSGAQTPAFLK